MNEGATAAVEEKTDPLSKLVEIDLRLRAMDDEAKGLKLLRGQLEEQILEDWAEKCVQSINIRGMTAYLRSDFYCSKRSDASTEDVCQALDAAGLGYMNAMAYNAQRLKAWVKETIESGEELPSEVGRLINHGQTFKIVCVKG